MTTHDSIRHWIADQMQLDIGSAELAELATLDAVTAAAEAGYVRMLLRLREYQPLAG
ncbi:hypothetical protein I1A62_02065 (plasmid) [Rhodococcus sp. USK10]|uniref:hypothetical protein n=1 Tax=Rhodococcus sp. USK10 TaxID=2789739 RepID=UPI001C5CD9EC|nr:hypothetical protein [Rhodococcus sp. USK10]QYA99948.1 hypothetical protein I1A62_02065 [Rhodococcus sp. USK10]